jgi:hypothetical protein
VPFPLQGVVALRSDGIDALFRQIPQPDLSAVDRVRDARGEVPGPPNTSFPSTSIVPMDYGADT